MEYATVRLVFDRKHVATKAKAGLVQIEVCYHRKRKWIGTGVKLFSGQWNPRLHVVNHLNSIELNAKLASQIGAVEDYIAEQIKIGEDFSFEKLSDFLKVRPERVSFIDFIEQRIDERGDIGVGTKRNHRTMLNAVKEFGKMQYMDEVTKANISRFDDWLHDHDYKQTTVWGYHKRLKAYINESIRFEMLDKNPYMSLKFERGKSSGVRYLLKEEINAIEDCILTSPFLDRVRDLFVFQCYTGLSYSDLEKFKWEDVTKEGENYIIRDVRRKTDEEYYIVLLAPALRVLEKYDYVLPIISNAKYNIYLKSVVACAGIMKPVSSHWARHSYAVMALSLGVRMELISKMLGHANTRITESTYAKVLATDLKESYRMLDEKLKR